MQLPDTQNTLMESRRLRKVGIRQHKQMVEYKGVPLLCTISAYVSLNGSRGTHFSRIISSIEDLKFIDTKDLRDCSMRLKEKLDTECSFIKVKFIRPSSKLIDQPIPF